MVCLVFGLDKDILVQNVGESMLAGLRSTLQETAAADRQATVRNCLSAAKLEVCCSTWKWNCDLGW